MTEPMHRQAAYNRRKLIRTGTLLSARDFCRQRGISRVQLALLLRRQEAFAVTVDHKPYYPALLAGPRPNRRRLTKLLKGLPTGTPPVIKYDLLFARRGSLGDKSPAEVVRRGDGYRRARSFIRSWPRAVLPA